MRFEHLVQINDLMHPTAEILTRNQVWQGLVYRAEFPMEFVEHIDEAEVLQRHNAGIHRRVLMGKLEVIDHIYYEHEASVHYDTQESEMHLGGQMWMKIEEPQEGALFIRFIYETPHPVGADPELDKYLSFLKSAWQETDIDTVKMIRQLAQDGKLG
ncbi:SRPBCC family protein [Chitinibacter sp. SCUT-21]|uniref:SRPBCC family protein n=1 Tax=Chitinibacter sp. SCUT-21 TaxID=2970891 RepID=UPI0035A5DD8A